MLLEVKNLVVEVEGKRVLNGVNLAMDLSYSMERTSLI